MQRAWLALMVAGAVSAAMPAAARDLPYCIKGCDFGGGAGDCRTNPYFNAKAEMPPDRSRPNGRRF
jgi:hypothetical protein